MVPDDRTRVAVDKRQLRRSLPQFEPLNLFQPTSFGLLPFRREEAARAQAPSTQPFLTVVFSEWLGTFSQYFDRRTVREASKRAIALGSPPGSYGCRFVAAEYA